MSKKSHTQTSLFRDQSCLSNPPLLCMNCATREDVSNIPVRSNISGKEFTLALCPDCEIHYKYFVSSLTLIEFITSKNKGKKS